MKLTESVEYTRSLSCARRAVAAAGAMLCWVGWAGVAGADTVTDWDAKAVAAASPAALGERESAIVNLAMFDAVNSIEQRYQPYLVKLAPASPTSAEAAAASAAATALAGLHPESAASFKAEIGRAHV